MSREMTSLFRLAIASGRLETVQSHLQRGADANARDNTGSPALLIAASRGRFDICKLLLDHGADPAASDASGRTLSEYASQWGFLEPNCLRDEQPSETEPEPIPTPPNYVAAAAADEGEEMFGWEPDIESSPPADDAEQVGAAHAAHDVFSRANASVDAADWSSVAVELPRSLGGPSDRLPPSVAFMVSRGLHTGWISGGSLRSALSTAKIRGELAIPLKFVLSDLGIAIRDTAYEDMLLPDDDPPVGAALDEKFLTEVVEHVSPRAGHDIESLYLLETQALRVGAAGIQPILWARAEELRRRAAAAFASLPGGLQHLEAAGAAFAVSEDNEPARDDVVDAADGDEPDRSVDGAEEVHPAGYQFTNALIHLPEGQLADHLIELRLPLAVMKRAVELAAVNSVAGVDTIRTILEELEARLARVVEMNLSLVTWFANRYRFRGVEYLDVVQEGNIGLMTAVQRFDPSRGASLGTYAIWWIRQAITRAIADTGRTIRVPVHVQDSARKLQRVRATLRAETGAQPTAKAVARKMEMTETSVATLEARTAQFVPTKGDNVERLKRGMIEGLPDPTPGPDATTWEWELRKELDSRLADLDPRQAKVLRLRFGLSGNDEHTLEEVGAIYGVTRERIRQIEAKALKIIAHPSRSKELKVFLDD